VRVHVQLVQRKLEAEMSGLIRAGMGWPQCAVCRKPVDKVESMDDPLRRSRRFRVSCHGEAEEGELSDLQMLDAVQIEFGLAFERAALEVSHER
jgi:hypothetical protein